MIFVPSRTDGTADEFPSSLPQDMPELENATNDHVREPHELQDSEDIISKEEKEGKRQRHLDRIHLVERIQKIARENALG